MPFDPENPTFYGESLPIEIARDISGTAVATKYLPFTSEFNDGWAVTKLYDDDATLQMDAGDSVLFGAYPEYAYLQEDSEAVFTAVFELAAGSAGSFRVHAGIDPAFNLTSETLATENLGTFTAAQGRVLVEVPTSYTVPMIYEAEVQPLLFVEMLSGSMIIRQIRIRMWPPEGPSGAWATDPSFALAPVRPRASWEYGEVKSSVDPEPAQELGGSAMYGHVVPPGTYGGWDDFGDREPPFQEMVAAFANEPFGPYQSFTYRPQQDLFLGGEISGSFNYSWALRSLFTPPGHDWNARYQTAMVVLSFMPATRTSRAPGNLNFADPDRVPYENSDAVRDPATGGALKTVFGGWSEGPTIDAGSGLHPEHIKMTMIGSDDVEWWDETSQEFISGSGFIFYYFSNSGFSASAGSSAPAAGEITLPNSPVVAISLAPEFLDSPPGSYTDFDYESFVGVGSFTGGSRAIDYMTTRVIPVVPEFEYFDPTLPWVPDFEYPEPRLFISDWDDEYYPVGMGKPAGMLKVGRIWTPMGMYRDLTYNEYVTIAQGGSPPAGAYPFYIKRYDESLDHVGWMVRAPEDDP